MIELTKIEKVYRTRTIETLALSNINLKVEKGEFLSIMGPSGCGKSTLLNIMGLLDEPSSGNIQINGQRINQYTDKVLASFRNQTIGFIFQSYHLINDLSVIDNVEIPLLYRRVSGKERRQLAAEALEKVGLANRMKHFPNQLSGGQKQRVAIARAIVGRPNIILADEPTGNLDLNTGKLIIELLRDLNKEKGVTIISATHDHKMLAVSDRIIWIRDGRVDKIQNRADLKIETGTIEGAEGEIH